MNGSGRMLWLVVGLVLGIGAAVCCLGPMRSVQAANDRFEDYIMCTGAASTHPRAMTDGIWLLDYRAGKLLGTVVDRQAGKIVGWAEVDLVTDFGIAPREHVHFMMTTGNIALGQAALYIAETSSGKFGVYTMGPRADGVPGIAIRRHDLATFRKQVAAQ